MTGEKAPTDHALMVAAANDLLAKHPDIGVMDEPVANLAAHVYLRHQALVRYGKENPAKILGVLGISGAELLRPDKLRLHPADIPTDYALVNEFIKTLRNTIGEPSYQTVRELLFDMLDYRIANAQKKSLLRRRFERRWHKPTITDDSLLRDMLTWRFLEYRPCTARVVMAGPLCRDPAFRCDIVVPAKALAPVADNHAQSTFGGSIIGAAARDSLAIWMSTIDPTDERESVLRPEWAAEMHWVAENFALDGTAAVRCRECKALVPMARIRKERQGQHETWRCPASHLLRDEELPEIEFLE